ncbi:hypothetical protein MYX75_08045 [Acidobacteria bacterium AH-259-A15]|nr:hypothetical protein [Acidobacteria bacterium AH-259-A15]
MSETKRLTFASLIACLCCLPALSGSESVSFRIAETRAASCCPGEKEIVLRVHQKQGDQGQEVVVEGRFASVEEVMVVPGEKLLVMGQLPRGGNIISVVDSSANRQETTIWNYGHSLSPSGRYLLYQTWYPRMVAPEARRSILVLYDLSKTLEANRLNPRDFTFQETPGFPVYPDANLAQQSYNILLEELHLTLSPLLWSSDDGRIVFIDHYRNQNHLVVVDLAQGLESVKILRKALDVMQFALPDKMTDETRSELKERPYKFSALDIGWLGPDAVLVRTYPQYWLPQDVILKLP